MYKKILDKISKFIDQDAFSGEISAARKEYFDRIGPVYEDDAFFESRMAAFFEWFLFERPVEKTGLAPIRMFTEANQDKLSDEEKEQLNNLKENMISLFLVKKKNAKGYLLQDLYDKSKYLIPKSDESYYVSPGNIIEARIIPDGNGYAFSDAVFSHPDEVSKIIKKQSKRYRKKPRNEFRHFIFDLATMSIKTRRYKHLALKDIYKFDEKK